MRCTRTRSTCPASASCATGSSTAPTSATSSTCGPSSVSNGTATTAARSRWPSTCGGADDVPTCRRWRGRSSPVTIAVRTATGWCSSRGVPIRESCIWDFNRLYWQALDRWEQATGRMYESALPGGESDARNVEAVRELITRPVRMVGPAGRPQRPARGAVRHRARRRQREPGQHVARRVRRRSRRSWVATTTAGSTTSCATTRRTCSSWPGRPSPRTPPTSARSCWTPPADHGARLPQVQGLPRLRLQRLRQPADRRGGPPRRPQLPGRDARLPPGRGRRGDSAEDLATEPDALPAARRQAAAARAGAAGRDAAGAFADVAAAVRLLAPDVGGAAAWRSATRRWPGSTCTSSRRA